MGGLHIGIAGAGLLGRLLAWRLASGGHRVEVFDPAPGPQPAQGRMTSGLGAHGSPDSGEPGEAAAFHHAAGFTAAGMLSPLAELECADADVAALGWRSLELWPQHVEALTAATGLPVHFAQRGSLLLAHPSDRGSAQRLLALLAQRAAPTPPRTLDATWLKDEEPELARGLLGWLLDGEGQIHTVQAMAALAAAGTLAGVQWHWGHAVEAVESGRLDDRRFDLAIDVRGTGAKPALPMRGVRGEVFWLHAPGLRLGRPARLLHPRHRVYLVPRPGDLIVVGASEIESEDRSPVSLRTTVELLAAAHSVLPALAEARVVHSESNLRPALPDNLPRVERAPGLLRINGLFRHGWLIAPALVERALAGLQDLHPSEELAS
ncbi:FAD-dependent oxidoreductase [Caldimonas tepidiphila]|uniref:FAD-dependent oxidoreductase n=1 Tax=Caldimonas tepidiphila TaxID=2315841 RepID=UPI00196B820F|nr:FAD-dependent oxidoreductase [Caldimonas tepidiphila]